MLHYVPHSVLYTALPIGNRRSCFVCRRTPGPALHFGIEMIVRCHIRHFLIRGYKGRFRHKSFFFVICWAYFRQKLH